MCGRFELHTHPAAIALAFGLPAPPFMVPRYNIAPMQPIPVVRLSADGTRECVDMRWGFVPRWAKDPSVGGKMNNARAETVAEKPSFREAYRKRRCLIPANGYYEWKPEGGRKQPYYIYPSGGALFAFAGLWEQWNDLETCTVITTEANEKMAAVADRMPVIVSPAEYSAWLEGGEIPLRACPDTAIDIRRVSRAVNNARTDTPELLGPDVP